MPSTASHRVSERRPFSESPIGRVGAVFVHFSRRSTIHGLNHMAQARTNKRRLYWLMISICASSGFFVNLYYLFEKYFQVPVLTNVLHDYAMFEFPDITFCLLNPVYFPPKNTSAYDKVKSHIHDYDYYRSRNDSWKVALGDFLWMHGSDKYSHPPWSVIVQCNYEIHRRDRAKCNYNSFIVRRLWPYGNCFTFDAKSMNSTRKVSLDMKLNSFRPDFKVLIHKSLSYPNDYKRDPHHSIWMSSGIIVMIHEAQTFPHISDSFLVDGVTQIDIRITRLHHLPKKTNCQEHRANYTYYDNATASTETFLGTPPDCMDSLLQELMARHCKCLPFHRQPLNKLRHYPVCNIKMHSRSYLLNCTMHMQMDIHKHYKNAGEECLKDLCQHTAFSTVISQAKYPALRERNTYQSWLEILEEMEAKEIQRFNKSDFSERALTGFGETHNINLSMAVQGRRIDLLNLDYVENNFMMLRVVPTSFFMDRIEEVEEYPLSRLLSDIGGCVGLWIGASLITLFEFIDLMFDFADQTAVYQRRKQLRKKSAMNGKYSYSSVPPTLYNGCLKTNATGMFSSPNLLEGQSSLAEMLGCDDETEYRNDIVRGLCAVTAGNVATSLPTSDSELSTPLKTISTDLVTTV